MQAELDKHTSPTGMKVSKEERKRLNLSPAKLHGKDWNYAIKPYPREQEETAIYLFTAPWTSGGVRSQSSGGNEGGVSMGTGYAIGRRNHKRYVLTT